MSGCAADLLFSLEKALRLAAATDPALAQRWLQAFKDSGRRDAFAREFNLTQP